MKDMSGGMENFQDIFKSFAKMNGVNIPKNAKFDTNAMTRLTEKQSLREKMKERMMNKKMAETQAKLLEQQRIEEAKKNYKPFDFSL
jgi:penicillin V acylase-like amidase (Ntn superfamily)